MSRGAAFDLDLEYAIGEAIGDEMQAAKQTVLLAPCMNILRHPLWGRAQETYGEDSFHVGRLASAMVVGVQQHIAANAKHYMGYDIENGRTQTNNSQMADEQVLRETYGRHFRMTVQDAGVASVMASYNEVNGIKSTQNGHILTDVLRNDFGFKGFVLSDWWAMPGFTSIPDSSTQKTGAIKAINAGLDVELPWGLYYGQLENLVNSGTLSRQDLQTHAERVLQQKFRFNSQSLSGNVGLKAPVTIYQNSRIKCNDSHRALAKQAALESMVLLKNDKGTLPISPMVKKVAVLGANIPYTSVDGGNGSAGANRTVNFATDVRTGDLGSSRAFSDPDPKQTVGPAAGITMTAPAGVNVVSGTSADVAVGRRLHRRRGRAHPRGRGRGVHGRGRPHQLRAGRQAASGYAEHPEQAHHRRGRSGQADGGRPGRWQRDRHALAGPGSRGRDGLVPRPAWWRGAR